MSGFSRGGRGGGRGGAGGSGLTREKLPFELDPDIEVDRRKLQEMGKDIDGEFDDPGSDWDEHYPVNRAPSALLFSPPPPSLLTQLTHLAISGWNSPTR